MPVVCCWCNASGRCKNCACKKAGRECLNCLPRRRGHCENSTPLAPTVSDANGLRTTTPPTQDTSNERIERGESGVIENVRHSAINDNNMVDDMTGTVTSIPETQMPTQSETQPNLEQDVEDLPAFTPVSEPDFLWGEVDGKQFACALNRVYEEVVQWRRNLLQGPHQVKLERLLFENYHACSMPTLKVQHSRVWP